MPAWGAFVAAAPLGVIACGAALNGADEEIWPALLIGPAAAGGASLITRDVVGGAARRAQASIEEVRAQTPAGVVAIVVLVAAVLAVLSLVLPPVSLVVLVAFIWLWDSAPAARGAQARGPARPQVCRDAQAGPRRSRCDAPRDAPSARSRRTRRRPSELLERGKMVPDCVSSSPRSPRWQARR